MYGTHEYNQEVDGVAWRLLWPLSGELFAWRRNSGLLGPGKPSYSEPEDGPEEWSTLEDALKAMGEVDDLWRPPVPVRVTKAEARAEQAVPVENACEEEGPFVVRCYGGAYIRVDEDVVGQKGYMACRDLSGATRFETIEEALAAAFHAGSKKEAADVRYSDMSYDFVSRNVNPHLFRVVEKPAKVLVELPFGGETVELEE